MHRESQVVRVEAHEGTAFGIITQTLAFHCRVEYFADGEWKSDYFEYDDVEVIGEIGYEVE